MKRNHNKYEKLAIEILTIREQQDSQEPAEIQGFWQKVLALFKKQETENSCGSLTAVDSKQSRLEEHDLNLLTRKWLLNKIHSKSSKSEFIK